MNREKYPNYFLAVCILYAIIFLTSLSYFILPSLGFGFAYGEFTLIILLMFLPMLLLMAYAAVPHLQFLWGKEKILRLLVVVFTVIDFCFVLFLMIFLI